MKVRRNIEIAALWIFLFSVFTWLLTGIEMLLMPVPELRIVIEITKDTMLWSCVTFMGAAWWNTIKRFFKRIHYTFVE